MTAPEKDIIHLLNRATFGPNPKDLSYWLKLSKEEAVERLFSDSEFYLKLSSVPEKPGSSVSNISDGRKRSRQLRVWYRKNKQKLNAEWYKELAESPAQLRERMAFFWHDHFSCNIGNPIMHQRQINTIRKYSLEYFGDLVLHIAKDPCMLHYLNGNRSVKDNPNENFGRELLELFTIGIGNYSEADIKEAARAFTGWRFRKDGSFFVKKELHDAGLKEFMGEKDYFGGEDILQMIFSNPKTGHFIVSKIYYYLLGKEISKRRLNALSASFYKSGYHIGSLVKKILTSDWFYDAEFRGIKVKSPIELMVGISRLTQLQFNNGSLALNIQRKLGQALFYPPNVSGWVNGRDWLDITSITERLNLPRTLLKNNSVSSKVKKSVSQEEIEIIIDTKDNITTLDHDLKPLYALLEKQSSRHSKVGLNDILYSVPHNHLKRFIARNDELLKSKRLNRRTMLISYLSQPEYQFS